MAATGLLLAACCLTASLAHAAEAAPPFAVRAFHVDNRIQVMPLPALKRLVNRLSDIGVNTLIMEWEGSFPFRRNAVISNRYAYTREEVVDLVHHCESLGIDVIPLQQCFGHLEYVLKHERYAPLREDKYDLSQVCPLEAEKVLSLYGELLDEITELHPSEYVHIGGDETYLLGDCERCSAFAQEHGKSSLFVRHIKSIADLVIERGKTPVLWADIIMKHPEAIGELPPECVLVNWNYGWPADRFGDHQAFVNSGFEKWGALALRSSPDNYFHTSWTVHLKNLEDFIPVMRDSGYEGVVMTSWSTSGIYTYKREPRRHVVEIDPVRHVYPLGGFNLLVAAYGDAMAKDGFDPELFVTEYCRNEYGLDAQAAETFWRVITTPGEHQLTDLQKVTPSQLERLRTRCVEASEFFRNARVLDRQDEFAHYLLMSDIRLQFIETQIVRSKIEASEGDPEQRGAILREIERLREVSRGLDERFQAAHNDSLYPGSVAEENRARNLELNLLYDKVAKRR